jgi:hypothetical protein
MLDRRTWLRVAAVAAVLPWPAGAEKTEQGDKPGMKDGAREFSFPVYQVSGATYGELGYRIGVAGRERILAGLASRKKWVDELASYAAADRSARLDPFLNAIRDEMPHLEDELKGIAEGCGLPFERLFSVCLNPELSAMRKTATYHQDCTTVAVNTAGKLWVAHNEDGSCKYLNGMYLLDITWPRGGKTLCLSYPGYWPGNGPMINSSGLFQTVNYIGSQAVKPGLPRYAIDRAILEAKNLGQAVALATHPKRSYSQHHLIASRREHKMVSIETAADKFSVLPVTGVFVHANHYVHPAMKDAPQFPTYKSSSLPRQKAADEWAADHPDPARLTPDDLVGLMSSHKYSPHPICRHSSSGASGCTLASVLVTAETKLIRMFEHAPCQRLSRDFPWPAPRTAGRAKS